MWGTFRLTTQYEYIWHSHWSLPSNVTDSKLMTVLCGYQIFTYYILAESGLWFDSSIDHMVHWWTRFQFTCEELQIWAFLGIWHRTHELCCSSIENAENTLTTQANIRHSYDVVHYLYIMIHWLLFISHMECFQNTHLDSICISSHYARRPALRIFALYFSGDGQLDDIHWILSMLQCSIESLACIAIITHS